MSRGVKTIRIVFFFGQAKIVEFTRW